MRPILFLLLAGALSCQPHDPVGPNPPGRQVFVVPASTFAPEHSGTVYLRDGVGSYVTPGVIRSHQVFLAALDVPAGEIRRIEYLGYRTTDLDQVQASVTAAGPHGELVNLGLFIQADTGYERGQRDLHYRVPPDYVVLLRFDLMNDASIGGARALWMKVVVDP